MNKVEANLLDAAANHLRLRDLVVAIKEAGREDHVDAWVRVTKDKQRMDYAVEVQRHITPQTLGAVVAQLKQHGKNTRKPPLLVTSYVTPPMAERLTALEQQFVDAAGNAYQCPGDLHVDHGP